MSFTPLTSMTFLLQASNYSCVQSCFLQVIFNYWKENVSKFCRVYNLTPQSFRCHAHFSTFPGDIIPGHVDFTMYCTSLVCILLVDTKIILHSNKYLKMVNFCKKTPSSKIFLNGLPVNCIFQYPWLGSCQ